MELEELVTAEIETFEPLDASKSLKDDDWAADGREGREVITAQVEFFKVLKVEHVVRKLFEIIGREV